jgi:integrase/recombinase XerD
VEPRPKVVVSDLDSSLGSLPPWRFEIQEPPLSLEEVTYAFGVLRRLLGLEATFTPPLQMLPPPKPKTTKRRLPRTLSREEMERLLRVPDSSPSPTRLRDRCMLELMYRAGLRVGEVVNLETRDVDTERGTVRIVNAKTGDRSAWFDAETVGPLIERWKAKKEELGLRSSWLFCTTRGGRYSPTKGKIRSEPGGKVDVRTVQIAIKRYAKRAGIDGAEIPRRITPHVLRHTFASELVEENMNIRKVQKRLGHEHLNSTQVYTHVMDADLMREAQKRAHPLADEDGTPGDSDDLLSVDDRGGTSASGEQGKG